MALSRTLDMVSSRTAPTAERRIVYRLPPLYPRQHEAIYDPARYVIVEASVKSGKTSGCLVWLLDQALAAPRRTCWWVAPVYAQTEIAFRRLKRALGDGAVPNESRLTLQLPNGSTLWFRTAERPDTLYGEDVHAAVLDEVTRMREEAWHAVRSTLAHTGGPARLIGNVRGRRNWAYLLARRAEQGLPDWAYHRLTAHDAVEAGVLTAEEVEDARRSLPERVFQELFEAHAADDAANPFGIDAIQACIAPLSRRPAAVWGVDLARAQDWTVAIALDEDGSVCALERWQAPWEDTVRRLVRLIGDTPALVDATGVGDPIVERLQRECARVEGYVFTTPSKQRLMEELALALAQRRVRYPDGVLVRELESYEYVYSRTGVRYSAPEGLHDDCVCALALAVHHLPRARGGALWFL